jgi:hypothetical protein
MQASALRTDYKFPSNAIAIITTFSFISYEVIAQVFDRHLTQRSKTYQKLSIPRRARFISYVRSTINAFVLSSYGAYRLTNPMAMMVLPDYYFMSTWCGYFLHDTYISRNLWLKYPVDFIHHIISLLFMATAYYSQKGISEAPFYCLLEISTFCINVCWMIKEFNPTAYLASKTYFLFQTLFVLSFFSFRIVHYGLNIAVYDFEWPSSLLSTGSHFEFLRSEYLKMHIIAKISYKAVYGLQLMWFVKIVRLLIKEGKSKESLKNKSTHVADDKNKNE